MKCTQHFDNLQRLVWPFEGKQKGQGTANMIKPTPYSSWALLVTQFLLIKKNFFIEEKLIYNVVPISAVQQWLSCTHIYILFLSHQILYSFLCFTVGPCLSILNVIICIYQPQIPYPSLFFPPSPLATTSLTSV